VCLNVDKLGLVHTKCVEQEQATMDEMMMAQMDQVLNIERWKKAWRQRYMLGFFVSPAKVQ
jgi:hypothetical protein